MKKLLLTMLSVFCFVLSLPAVSYGKLEFSENDIIINEVMFDPTPRIGLPDAEYVEIYNNSNDDIQLENWKLIVGSKTYTLTSYIIGKGEYLLLTKDIDLFPDVNTLKVNITSLTNSGTTLKLESNFGQLVNQVSYSTSLFSDKSKNDGGWSLELINPNNNCLGLNNWIGSKSALGGTPGLSNSVADFDYFPNTENFITKVTASDNVDVVSVSFNGAIDENSFFIDTDFIQDYYFISNNKADGSSEIVFNLSSPIGNEVNYFVFNNLLSCNGSEIITDTIWVSSFGDLAINDIIVNEVMFNPKDESSEFIEIHNTTDKFLSLRNVYISNFTTSNQESEKDGEKLISYENIIFPPLGYIVLTENTKLVIDYYKSNTQMNFVEISSLPKLNNDEGNVAILNPSYGFVDKMYYSSDMHLGLISADKQKGISLERIKSSNPSLDFNNWTSASQSSGGATPGFVNSVSPSDFVVANIFDVFPEVFSPNNDGNNDVVELIYNLDIVGAIANVKVFNSNGVFIKEIANNYLLGAEGSFIWNGMNKDNSLCDKGIYIFWVELFDSEGNVDVYKIICVLG